MSEPERYAVTFEADNPDAPLAEQVGVKGIRHLACVLPGQVVYGHTTAAEMEAAGKRALAEGGAAWEDFHGPECWGCDGWLAKPPLTPEETARLRALREEDA